MTIEQHYIRYENPLQSGAEKRKFRRYSLATPLQIRMQTSPEAKTGTSCDISLGGLSFLCDKFLAKGGLVTITVPVSGQLFRVRSEVVYSNRIPSVSLYRTGISFRDSDAAFTQKLEGQFRAIEEFRQELTVQDGRAVSDEETARRWVEKFASLFKNIF